MTMTTIKVDVTVRDRLASVAKARGVTMASLMRDISSELEARLRWSVIETAYQQLRQEDPQAWAEYVAELDAWDSAAADPGHAVEEWPEYNA
jgi:hypothetical protein